MYSQKFIRFIFLLTVVCSATFTGEAFASPESRSEQRTVNERIEYAKSLNSIASTLMNWYGSLIIKNESQTTDEQDSITDIRFLFINHAWKQYRTTYPEKIISIQIMSADLVKQDSPRLYKFEIEVFMTVMESDTPQNKMFQEVFLFQTSDARTPEIKKVTRFDSGLKNNTTDLFQTAAFKHQYYKSREFAYAWLAYLDGVKAMGSRINSNNWLDKARYSVKIGSFELIEQLTSALQKRNEHLGDGGHLLRSITAKEINDKPGQFELDIIIDWKGKDPSGLPAIAKINQVIQYKLEADGSWLVLSIKEKHLLPDLHPWQNILC